MIELALYTTDLGDTPDSSPSRAMLILDRYKVKRLFETDVFPDPLHETRRVPGDELVPACDAHLRVLAAAILEEPLVRDRTVEWLPAEREELDVTHLAREERFVRVRVPRPYDEKVRVLPRFDAPDPVRHAERP